MSSWLECSTLVEAEAVDAVAEVFGRFGQGVAIEQPIVSSADGEQVRVEADKPISIKTYVPCDERAEERRRQLEEAVWHLGQIRRVEPLAVREIHESDWAEAWKEHFYVHRVGERIVIVPSWREFEPEPGDLVVHLDPGMAFGTGLHPTTRLCLEALQRSIRGGEAVLDLGTGSAILAIAAALLGAGRVLALEIEPVAVRVAGENVARNELDAVIDVRPGSLPMAEAGEAHFDLVVANISFRVLSELHPDIRRVLRPGGLALLSGVLEADAPKLVELLAADGWRLVERRAEGDWSLLALVVASA
jgi:ribosomal protein L11 methyltransferase